MSNDIINPESEINIKEKKTYSLEEISKLSGLNRKTVTKRLKESGIDWKVESIENILSAVLGNSTTLEAIAKQRLLYIKEQTQKLEIENQRKRGELIERIEISNKLSTLATSVKNILSNELLNVLPNEISNMEINLVRKRLESTYDKLLEQIEKAGRILNDNGK